MDDDLARGLVGHLYELASGVGEVSRDRTLPTVAGAHGVPTYDIQLTVS